MSARIQIKRTPTVNNPPANNSLSQGELAVEMASSPPKLWVGVPTSIDASGQVLLASGAGVSVANDFGFRATKGGVDQTGIGGSVDTKLTFTTEELDRGGYYDAPNSRWTPPAGFVHITALVNFSATAGGVTHYLGIAKNGVVQKRHYMMVGSGEGGFGGIETAFDDYTDGTNYYEAYYRVEGAAGTVVTGNILYTYFQGHITGGRGPQGAQGIPGAPGSSVLLASYDLGGLPYLFNVGPLSTLYDVIEFDCHFIMAAASQIAARFSTDNGATYYSASGSYWTAGPYSYYTIGSGAHGFTEWGGSPTQIPLTIGNVGTQGASSRATLKKPTAAGNLLRWFEINSVTFDGTNVYQQSGAGALAATYAPITHVQFITMSGAAWGAGSWIKMYGR